MSTDRHCFLSNLTLHKELVIVVLDFSPNQWFVMRNSRNWEHIFPGSLHCWSRTSWLLEHDRRLLTLTSVVRKVQTKITTFWLYVKSRGKFKRMSVLCFVPHPSLERTNLNNCCAWILTEPEMHGAWLIPRNVDVGGSKEMSKYTIVSKTTTFWL